MIVTLQGPQLGGKTTAITEVLSHRRPRQPPSTGPGLRVRASLWVFCVRCFRGCNRRTPVRHLFLVKCLCICKQADRELRLGNFRSPLTIILLNARRGPLSSAFNCAVRGVRARAKPTGSKVKDLYSPPTRLPMGGEVKISN